MKLLGNLADIRGLERTSFEEDPTYHSRRFPRIMIKVKCAAHVVPSSRHELRHAYFAMLLFLSIQQRLDLNGQTIRDLVEILEVFWIGKYPDGFGVIVKR